MDSRRFHIVDIILYACLVLGMLFVVTAVGLIFDYDHIDVNRATTFLVVEGILLLGAIVLLLRTIEGSWKNFFIPWFLRFMIGSIHLVISATVAGVITWFWPVMHNLLTGQWMLTTAAIALLSIWPLAFSVALGWFFVALIILRLVYGLFPQMLTNPLTHPALVFIIIFAAGALLITYLVSLRERSKTS